MTLYRRTFGYGEGLLPQAERVAAETIALPVNPRLTAEDMGYISDVIRAASRNELPSA
jgi:dTDP-4-amino-4,6-dideoxygalactose transaminase